MIRERITPDSLCAFCFRMCHLKAVKHPHLSLLCPIPADMLSDDVPLLWSRVIVPRILHEVKSGNWKGKGEGARWSFSALVCVHREGRHSLREQGEGRGEEGEVGSEGRGRASTQALGEGREGRGSTLAQANTRWRRKSGEVKGFRAFTLARGMSPYLQSQCDMMKILKVPDELRAQKLQMRIPLQGCHLAFLGVHGQSCQVHVLSVFFSGTRRG
jgi:hypothetical protein